MAERSLPWRVRFALRVSQATGLDFFVVYGWTYAEGGPASNPLNIGPGRRYASADAAAAATVELLRTDRYAGILRAAREGGAREQLRAIELSPWNLGTTGAKPAYGELLRGTYERAKREALDADSELGRLAEADFWALPDVAGAVVEPVVGAVEGAIEGVADFAFDKAALALGYALLTAASAALFVMGLNRVSGSAGGPTVQGAARVAVTAATRGRGDDIPF